ncbi:MAG: hypothetical protein RRC07_11630, partial [Anaerolineae bacterium]|nr:hypothetical protein [Anaerolineae bacterium]
AARRRARYQQNQLLGFEAAALLRENPRRDGIRIVRCAFTDRDPAQLRALASRLAANGGTVVLLGTGGQRAQLVFARAGDAVGQMDDLLQHALSLLEGARGGGTATFAQGGGPVAPVARVEQVLAEAERLLRAKLVA